MDKDKARNSLLYRLYHQYVKQDLEETKEEETSPETEESVNGEQKAGMDPEIEQTDSDTAGNGADHVSECEYLEPLMNVQNFLLGERQKRFENTVEFEEYVFRNVREQTSYYKFENTVRRFSKNLVNDSKSVLSDLLEREKLKTGTFHSQMPEAEVIARLRKPADAVLNVYLSEDKMFAFACLFPPYEGGKDLDRASIELLLAEKGVTFGVKEAALKFLSDRRNSFQIVLAAEGILPVAGENGKVIDHFQRSSEININQDENGQMDYKNLNNVQFVEAGEILCDIIPAGIGIAGMDVEGNVAPAVSGKDAVVPAGKNTILSEDKTQLIAGASGQILFRNNRFDVTEIFTIKENVDYSVGNLDCPGDIVIYGEVRAGFTVKAGGNITIYGMVEAATIMAEGDVILKKGMNGNHNGQIHAREVKASYLENCTVYTTGSIKANSIIACNLFCGDSIIAEGNIGAIIGGSITALHSVKARMIGSKSRRETIITLGTAPHLLTERMAAEKEQHDVADILDKLDKNISYLEKNRQVLPPDKLPVLEQLIQQQTLYHQRRQELDRKIAEFNSMTTDLGQCNVQSNMIFPPTKVSIGPYCYVFNTLSSKCNVFMAGNEITLGTLA